MTTNITTTTVSSGDSNKTVSISTMIGELDAAISEKLAIDLASANASLSATQLKGAQYFVAQNATTTGRTVTFATPSKRLLVLAVDSSCTHAVEFIVGSSNISITPSGFAIVYLDGTSNGLVSIFSSSGSSSLAALSDVALASLINNNVLTYDSGSSSWKNKPVTESFVIAVGDETTALTTGTAKVTFRMPYAFTLASVRSSLTTASSSGLPTVDLKMSGTSVFSTLLSIDASEKTSTTAATPAVLSTTALTDDAEMTIDITTAGTTAAGLKVTLIGSRT